MVGGISEGMRPEGEPEKFFRQKEHFSNISMDRQLSDDD